MNQDLLQLPDHLLLHIISFLSPLPDRFLLGRSCLRLKRLAHDYHHQLVVLPSITSSCTGGSQLDPLNSYKCLADAVAASRPGDVIALKNGLHSLREPVVIHHCLTLVSYDEVLAAALAKQGTATQAGITSPGSMGTALAVGSSQRAVLSIRGRKAVPALDVRATCRIRGLHVMSVVGPCILHRAGHLHVDSCQLEVDASGLDHLCAPLVTTAVSPPSAKPLLGGGDSAGTSLGVHTHGLPAGASKAGSTSQGQAMISASRPAEAHAAASGLTPTSGPHQARPLLSAATSLPPSGLPAAPAAMVRAEGAGKLMVMSTLLEGGAKAVRCEGSGELQAVRVIQHASCARYYFVVDSSWPGLKPGPVKALPGKSSSFWGRSVQSASAKGSPVAASGAGTSNASGKGNRMTGLKRAANAAEAPAGPEGEAEPYTSAEQQGSKHKQAKAGPVHEGKQEPEVVQGNGLGAGHAQGDAQVQQRYSGLPPVGNGVVAMAQALASKQGQDAWSQRMLQLASARHADISNDW